jgi:hypothetical protein
VRANDAIPDLAENECEGQTTLAVFPPHPEEGAGEIFSGNSSSACARLKAWGGPMVRDAVHEAAKFGLANLTAPHHEAGKDRECIKVIEQ